MTTLRTAAQQALEALEQSETFVPYEGFGMAHREAERKHQAAITALRAALAEPEYPLGRATTDVGVPVYVLKKAEPVQEPVALAWSNLEGTKFVGNGEKWKHKDCVVPLYTATPQRKPPIADEALWEMWVDSPSDVLAFARRIEMWHGIT